MAMTLGKTPATKKRIIDIVMAKFDGGVILQAPESKLPLKAAKEARNLMQVKDGTWAPRWGSDWYGSDLGATIDGAGKFVADNGDGHLVVVAGGTVYRSTDDGATWDTCSGGTFTAGNHVKMEQIKSELWMVNGTDNILKYDGTTTLVSYSSLTNVGTPSLTETGLTGTAFTYYFAVTANNDVGSTAAVNQGSITVSTDRDNWATDGSEYITVSWTAVSGANNYDVWIGSDSGILFYLGTTEDTTFKDDGSVAINQFMEAPVDNTTTAPKTKDVALSQNRLWLTNSSSNPWRVYWGGTGSYSGRFSPFYGGGWVDIEKGGVDRCEAVSHFQDGKGNSYTTVFMSNAEGTGSAYYVDLQTATIGDTTFLVPVVIKLVGAMGSSSFRSMVTNGNTILYANGKGIQSLGPRPQLLNLLDTKEVSANIRPFYQALKGSAVSSIAGYLYDAKVFFSVPYGSTANNRIMVLDTERNNWSPEAFDFGVEAFFEYSDTNGVNRFLAYEPSGTRLIEISSSIKGDKGSDFSTSYISPLIPLTRNRTGFAKIKRVFVELFSPKGQINIEVTGASRNKDTSTVAQSVLDTGSSASGWSSDAWTSQQWSTTASAPDTFSVTSLIRYLRVGKRLANIQIRLTTTSRNDYYELSSLNIQGYEVRSTQPSGRKL